MRIASLVPSATETLFALGLGEQVVGVTHECDFPADATRLPRLTRSVIPQDLSAGEIDQAVRERVGSGERLYELDAERLAVLEPDLIVTQELCEVCAVSYEDVLALARRLPSRPRVLSLDPTTLGEVLADVRRLGEAAGAAEAAERLLADAADRLDRVRAAVADAERPLAVALEWLEPVFVGGHWVPQMVELAGGHDPLGMPGERSRTAGWEEVEATHPDVALVIPCGYDAERSLEEARTYREPLERLGGRVVALDAAAYFSRPGPRLVEGVQLLAHVLHPDRVAAPPSGRFAELEPHLAA